MLKGMEVLNTMAIELKRRFVKWLQRNSPQALRMAVDARSIARFIVPRLEPQAVKQMKRVLQGLDWEQYPVKRTRGKVLVFAMRQITPHMFVNWILFRDFSADRAIVMLVTSMNRLE
jgi:hypothetical protein